MDGAPRAYISHRLRVSWDQRNLVAPNQAAGGAPALGRADLPRMQAPSSVVAQLLQWDPPIGEQSTSFFCDAFI